MPVIEFLRKQGFNPASPPEEMETWLAWYKGNTESFHSYTVYNGIAFTGQKRASMRMAKQICADWASLLLSERVEVSTEDERLNDLVQHVFEFNGFDFRANQLVEITFALGTGAFVEFFDASGQIVIDYVRGDCIYPLAWENGEITDCAFASVRRVAGKDRYYVAIHSLKTGGYVVTNHLIDKDSGKEVALPDGIAPEVPTRSSQPRFQIMQPNLVNNVDLDSPFGISVYANAIDRLKKVDLIFDSGNNEFQLGKKRIIVPLTMARTAVAEAQKKPIFDPNDVAFYGLDLGGDSRETQKPIDLTSDLRIEAHSQGLQDALNYLSDGVGLGTDRYEYQRGWGGVKTATEVVSEKSTLYQNLQRHKLPVRKAIIDLCKSIAVMAGMNPDVEISVNFDDSIIQDETAIRQKAMLEYQAGLIDEVAYFMETRGLDEETAKRFVADIKARQGETVETLMLPQEHAEFIEPEDEGQEER